MKDGRLYSRVLQIGGNGVSLDYGNKLVGVWGATSRVIEALLDPERTGRAFEDSPNVDVVPKKQGDSVKWETLKQHYSGVEGARAYLRYKVYGAFKKPHTGPTVSAFPIYSAFLKHDLRAYANWWKESGEQPLDLREAWQLLFSHNADAFALEDVTRNIRSTVRRIVDDGPTGKSLEEVGMLVQQGLNMTSVQDESGR
jgi:hypothetical protein